MYLLNSFWRVNPLYRLIWVNLPHNKLGSFISPIRKLVWCMEISLVGRTVWGYKADTANHWHIWSLADFLSLNLSTNKQSIEGQSRCACWTHVNHVVTANGVLCSQCSPSLPLPLSVHLSLSVTLSLFLSCNKDLKTHTVCSFLVYFAAFLWQKTIYLYKMFCRQ